MGAAAPVLIAGGILNAKSMADQTDAQSNALEEEAAIQEKNATLIREAGKFNANKQQMEADKIFGGIAADTAASGISQDSGSTLAILNESYRNAELDKLNIQYESEIGAANALNRAAAARTQASGMRNALPFRALSSVLGGGVNAYLSGARGGGDSSGGSYSGADVGGGNGPYRPMRGS